jgi:lysophospholipase L1-like esterase
MSLPRSPGRAVGCKKLVALLCGAVVAYAFGEILSRTYVPDPGLRFENVIGLFQEDPVVGYRNKPNFRGYAQGFIHVETNPLGYRGKEISVQKPENMFRILGLGDSVTWGSGVADEDTYLRILERKLNEALPGKTAVRFQTVNTGVVGYSTHQELLTLERDGVPLCPDLAIVGYEPNDSYPTEDPFHNVHTFHQPPKENVGRIIYPEPQPVRFYFYRLARAVGRRVGSHLRSKWATKPAPQGLPWPDDFPARAWPVMQNHFRAMKRLADEHDFRLLILLLPTSGIPADYPLHQSRVGEFLASNGINSLDLSDALRGQEREGLLDTIHLTPIGHRLVAEEILHYLEKHRWLPETGSKGARRCPVPSGLGR